MQCFLDSTFFQKHPVDLSKVCKIFRVSRNGYYSWLARQKDTDKIRVKREKRDKLKNHMREIIRKLGYVPGARTFREEFYRGYQIVVSRAECRELMEEMNLVANKPKKDAYKHQAVHDHEYAVPAENLVNRNFYVGPRKVILTDITYLYYGLTRNPFYLCVFKDAYTRELLGFACSLKMTVEDLVLPAYNMMKEKHGSELSRPDVYIHSDQGSQYLSTTFRKILEDDKFVQSVSRRGNSLDNSPMESFFGRLKTHILGIVALARDFQTASELVAGYMHDYTYENYQYDLAGLTPAEFYKYVITGIYPCSEYFGVDNKRLNTLDELIARRMEESEEIARKARERAARDKAEGLTGAGTNPVSVIKRDIRILEKKLQDWVDTRQIAAKQLEFLDAVLSKAEAALKFVTTASEELKSRLRTRQEWSLHPELSYIYDMKGLF